MITGFATADGTKHFAENSPAKKSNYKKFQSLTLSNVGIGTYLGNPDTNTDKLVTNAVKDSVLSGINVIDTAINYRSQKAERSVGNAIADLVKEGIPRDHLFMCTKNGYVTNDADIKQDFWTYIKNNFTEKGIIREGEISSSYHCMEIPFLSDQLERSLKNLGLDCIDLMYLHNAVEGQIQGMTKEEFLDKLKSVFELYEVKRSENKLRFYGMATWECFRVDTKNPYHIFLEDVVKIAKNIGGENHGFRFIQLPYNLYYDQALLTKTQTFENVRMSLIDAAKRLGIGVFTSVPFMQGKLLAPGVLPEFDDLIPPLRALQFIRSTPGVIAPLVGHKDPKHVLENLKIMQIPPIPEDEFSALVSKLMS